VLSGSVTSSAEPDTRCSGGGNYFINEGVAYRPSPAPAIKCTGDVVLDSSVVSIAANAFWGLSGIRTMVLPANLTTISSYAFNAASSLVSISIPSSVTSIGTNVFSGTISLATFEVSSQNQNFTAFNGALFNKTKTILIAYPAANSTKNFTIPATVNEIAEVALAGAKLLASVILEPGNGSYVIENGVLLNSERSELLFYSRANIDSTFTVPSSVTEISQDAFLNAFNLNEFKVSSTNITFLSDAGVLFDIDHEILVAYPSGNTSSTYILPATVISVGTNAFASS